MRILHLHTHLSIGGVTTILIDLAAAQVRMGHEVTIATVSPKAPLDDWARSQGIEVANMGCGGTFRGRFQAIDQILRNRRFDVIHEHWEMWFVGAIAARRNRIPFVHTHHASPGRRYFLQHRLACLFTDKVVLLTPEADEYILKWVSPPRRKMELIPNGIQLDRLNKVTRIEVDGIPVDAPVVGMAARIEPQKDYGTFIRAAKLVNAWRPEVHFVAIGDGSQRKICENLVKMLGVANFHFLGNRNDTPAIFRRMNINVLSTHAEGLSISLLEAMASGCVCAATDIPSNRYALDEERAGLLFPDGNPEALASAIERLLSDQELADTLRAHAMERSKYFDSRRMAEDYIKLYMTLLK
jgi:glycosyltransferase involved in cell wall biosynthesis